jgi:hypothetical protein
VVPSVWWAVVARHYVQHLYSRFAFLAFFAVLAALGINNLSVFNNLPGFDSRRFHHSRLFYLHNFR